MTVAVLVGHDVFWVVLALVVVLAAVVLVSLGISVWAFVDCLTQPDWRYDAIGASKVTWAVLIGVLYLVTGIGGLVCAVLYLTTVRPKLNALG